ncbi:methylated-DNA--[protein]-cysteine S-methyltransferase [Sphingomonas sp. CARO-RG-8B-R24-01]|uniref:methylated-DNA--[protein]-cysteine S-methyltransferase n=1 Tax=Sphingomonas sp. CARO-RG-8B-R24-01 TaxID=2914831 RepID=UPI001F5A14F3|nr:methylated-DNA--[protein]-cysteine S-methyltransferase [Sphingomonas sp. CARO-RG-8B-R24-01]
MYARDMARIATPVGTVTVWGDDVAVESITIDAADLPLNGGSARAVRAAAVQLEEWFGGTRRDFDLPLQPAVSPRGGALRAAMCAIPYGAAWSYGRLAAAAGSSARAIGQACARNPYPIVVPCHRVTNADGTLGAYSAGAGSRTKAWLLDFEARDRRGLL